MFESKKKKKERSSEEKAPKKQHRERYENEESISFASMKPLKYNETEFVPPKAGIAKTFEIPFVKLEFQPYNKAIASIYGDERTSDVVLFASDSDKKFYVHKNILAAQSKYFYKLFYDTDTGNVTEIRLEGISSLTLTSLLKFIYTVDIVPSGLGIIELIDLYNAANKLEFSPQHLPPHCLALMCNDEINATNVCQLWPWLSLLQEKHQALVNTLIERCKKCFRENTEDLFESRKYLIWNREFLLDHFLPHMCGKQKKTSVTSFLFSAPVEQPEIDPIATITTKERKAVLKIICEWIRCNYGVSYDRRGTIAAVSPFTRMEDLRFIISKLFMYTKELLEGGESGGLQFFATFFESCISDDMYLKDEAVLRIYQTISAGVL